MVLFSSYLSPVKCHLSSYLSWSVTNPPIMDILLVSHQFLKHFVFCIFVFVIGHLCIFYIAFKKYGIYWVFETVLYLHIICSQKVYVFFMDQNIIQWRCHRCGTDGQTKDEQGKIWLLSLLTLLEKKLSNMKKKMFRCDLFYREVEPSF